MRWLPIVLFPAGGQASPAQDRPDIGTVLARVRENIARLDTALPDFVADETIRSGKIVDGKPAAKGAQVKGPLVVNGGFFQSMRSTFGVQHEAFQVFSLAGTEPLNGRETIVPEFATKAGQTGMRLGWDGRGYLTNDTGNDWIDPASMQILRFRRTYSGLPHHASITLEVEFAETQVHGMSFFLPRLVSATRDKPGGKSDSRFMAEYTNYRKFAADSSVTFDDKPAAK